MSLMPQRVFANLPLEVQQRALTICDDLFVFRRINPGQPHITSPVLAKQKTPNTPMYGVIVGQFGLTRQRQPRPYEERHMLGLSEYDHVTLQAMIGETITAEQALAVAPDLFDFLIRTYRTYRII